MTCELRWPGTMIGTTSNENQTLSIEPCSLCESCYVKQGKLWCNHCVEVYEILDSIIQSNPNLPIHVYLGYSMKILRGKCSGELCEKVIRLLAKAGGSE